MFRNNLEKHLDVATSHLHLEPDWPSILNICDMINQKDVTVKNAFAAIKKKMNSPNPHSACYALLVLESVIKNCGSPMHEEVFTKENCEMFSTFLEQTTHENVRQKMLELVQTWAYAFRSDKYQSIKDTMNILKAKGHTFPEMKEADAMFTADTAPNWADGRVCHRCRDEFSFTNRKHHCRNCGQVFCGQCTSKQCPIPNYGIEKDVRVCDVCYTLLHRPTSKQTMRAVDSDLPVEYLNSSLAQQVQTPPRKTEEELKEEEELQLALALSQSEAEQKKQQHHQPQSLGTPAATYRSEAPSPTPEIQSMPKEYHQEESNPDLAKYLNRSYWEQRKVSDSPMASPSAPSPMPATPQPQQQQQQQQLQLGIQNHQPQQKSYDEIRVDEFAANTRTQLEIFVNRMKSNSSRGRSIANDSSVQTLFTTLTSLHSQQLSYIKEMDDKRMWYEQLQDKLAQIKDARAALDVLRQEHAEKLRRQAEELERQRQIQMAHKLEIMRKKKQEYLQYQRQLALQQIQEQEREMQMRQEQQKAQYLMGQTAFPFMPQAGMPPHGSPSHQLGGAPPGGPMFNPYAAAGYNPNSPGPLSGGLPYGATIGSNLMQSGGAPPHQMQQQQQSPMPGMYNPNMAMTNQQQMPGGMLMHGGHMLPHMSQQPNAPMMQQPTGDPNMQHPQMQQQQQQPQPPPPQQQLGHVMLQHQNVIQNQPPIPTPSQMPPSVTNGVAQPTHPQMQQQIQAPPPQQHQQQQQQQVAQIQAAPAPPQTEPEPPAAAPEEPATAELISFD